MVLRHPCYCWRPAKRTRVWYGEYRRVHARRVVQVVALFMIVSVLLILYIIVHHMLVQQQVPSFMSLFYIFDPRLGVLLGLDQLGNLLIVDTQLFGKLHAVIHIDSF